MSWSLGAGHSYAATGLPAGLTLWAAGLITGTPTTRGTSTVRVTVDGSTEMTFVWTVS